MAKPQLVISAPPALFASFFTPTHQRRLSRTFAWKTCEGKSIHRRLKGELVQAEALITTWDSPAFDDGLLQIAPKLRIVAHCGGEVKSRFRGTLLDRLTVVTAPEPMARATAELGAALILYCGRNLDFYRNQVRKRDSRIYHFVHLHGTPECIAGARLGMLGFGRIGRTIVELLRGFDVRWQVYDPYAGRTLKSKLPVKFVPLRSVLSTSTILVLTAALTDETRGLLDRKNLALLPDGATIVNVARGGLIELEALTREVRKGRLRCAIDVTDPHEPLPAGHPLRRLPGAICSPHIGGGTLKARHEMVDELLDNLERFFRGESVQNRVTTSMLARMT